MTSRAGADPPSSSRDRSSGDTYSSSERRLPPGARLRFRRPPLLGDVGGREREGGLFEEESRFGRSVTLLTTLPASASSPISRRKTEFGVSTNGSARSWRKA